jgi:hypothetical protein
MPYALKKIPDRPVHRPILSLKKMVRIQSGVARRRATPRSIPKAPRRSEANTISVACTLEFYKENQARCWAEISGARVPIDLPAHALRGCDIQKGMRFMWTFPEGQPVLRGRPQRVAEPVRAQHDWSREEQEEIDRLLAEAIESREQGEWAYLNER